MIFEVRRAGKTEQKKNVKKEELYEKECLVSYQGVFEIIKECFAYYYPLYVRRNISHDTHLMNLNKNFDQDVKIKQTSELILEVDTHQMKNLNALLGTLVISKDSTTLLKD